MKGKAIDADTRARFSYWRTRTFYSIFIGYIFYYFTRKSYTFAMPMLASEMGFAKSDLGILVTVFSITYGISKFACGILGDKSNPRYFMSAGLILTGVVNIAFGCSSSLLFFVLFWGLNGWFQGFGWPPCARLLTYWYSPKTRGTWWSMWSTSHNIGGAVIPLVVTACMGYWGWRYALYVPGILCILCGLFLFNRLRDTPHSLRLPSAEEIDGYDEQGAKLPKIAANKSTITRLLLDHVIFNRLIWFLALSNLFIYVVRTGINEWTVLYLSELHGFSLLEAAAVIPWFEFGGIFGTLLAGYLSDSRLIQANGGRGVIAALFMALLMIPLSFFWLHESKSYLVCSASLFFIGMCLFGPQMLVGCTAVEKTEKLAAGTASGFAGVFGYIGAAIAGYPFGLLIDRYGWSGFFFALLLASMLGFFCFLPVLARPKAVSIDSSQGSELYGSSSS